MNYISRLSPELQDIVRLVSRAAAGQKRRVYLVGGCVRDLMRGSRTFDLDFTTEKDGIALAESVARSTRSSLVRHRRFGTATLSLKHLKVDIATMRREMYPQPGHLPVVEAGTITDDLYRRDFTINAMALDVSRMSRGELVDPYGGRRDLGKRLIRVLHDKSFLDDPTRILRAVRFEQRYGFRIEPHTLKLLREAAASGALSLVDHQRLRDELILLLKEEHPSRAVKRLQSLAGLTFLTDGLRFDRKTEGFFRSIKRQVSWFRRKHNHRRSIDVWLMYFIALTDRLSDKEVLCFVRRLALARGDVIRVMSYKNLDAKKLVALRKRDVPASVVYRTFEPCSYETVLAVKAAHAHPCIQRHIADFFAVYNDIRVSISGHDIKALGVAPGPLYRSLFEKVLHAKVNGEIRSRADELAFIRRSVAALEGQKR